MSCALALAATRSAVAARNPAIILAGLFIVPSPCLWFCRIIPLGLEDCQLSIRMGTPPCCHARASWFETALARLLTLSVFRIISLVIPGRRASVEPGIHFAAECTDEWIPGPRHPSRLLPTWI